MLDVLQLLNLKGRIQDDPDPSTPAKVKVEDGASSGADKDDKAKESSAAAQEDLTALIIIRMNVDQDNMRHVRSARTAKEAWQAICRIHQDSSLSQTMFLMSRLRTVRLGKGSIYADQVQSHINTIMDISYRLEGAGRIITDKELAEILLASVNHQDWKHIILIIESQGHEMTSLKVRSMLLAEAQRNSLQRQDEGLSTSTALATISSLDSKPKMTTVCSHCSKPGHNDKICWEKNGYPPKHPLHKSKQPVKLAAAASTLCSTRSPNSHQDASMHSESSPVTPEVFGAFAVSVDQGSQSHSAMAGDWYLDSAASTHYCNSKSHFGPDYAKFTVPIPVTLGDGRCVRAMGSGSVNIHMNIDGNIRSHLFKTMWYVPELQLNLLSVPNMTRDGLTVAFSGHFGTISDAGLVIGRAEKSQVNSLYRLVVSTQEATAQAVITPAQSIPTSTDAQLWHQRLGHLNSKSMKHLQAITDGVRFSGELNSICSGCMMGKQHRVPLPDQATHRATEKLQLVHSDVCGPMTVGSLGGSYYFVLFIDDFSRMTTVKIMKSKDEVFTHFKVFKAQVEKQTGLFIKTFRSDQGGEFMSNEFSEFLRTNGIARQTSTARTPGQNGVAERANRTIVECARSMLHAARLPYRYWGEAINTAVYLKNRVPTRALDGTTPFEAWTGKRPNLEHLRVFGSKVYIHVADSQRSKLEPKSIEGIFLGYDDQSKAYRVYNPDRNAVVASRDVVIDERSVLSLSEPYPATSPLVSDLNITRESPVNPPSARIDINEQSDNELHTDVDMSSVADNDNDEVLVPEGDPSAEVIEPSADPHPIASPIADAPRRSGRPHIRVQPFWHQHGANAAITMATPSNFKQAMNQPDSSKWRAACEEEYASIIRAGTWVLDKKPEDRTAIGSTWIFKLKHDANGDLICHKARLVAQGFSQRQGIDFHEIFAPVAKFASIRAMIALSAHFGLHLHQMDVRTAYLNGELEETIFMRQPEGFVVKGKEHLFCRLKKSLYGLRQSGRAWYAKIDSTLRGLGFQRLSADHCLYRLEQHGLFVMLSVYVDDLLIASNSLPRLEQFKLNLARCFEMKDMGLAKFVLGIEIVRCSSTGSISINQRAYSESLLDRHGMADCKPVDTPLDPNIKLVKATEGSSMSIPAVQYQAAVGGIMYLMLGTRPDIAYAITTLSQFNNQPSSQHWSALKRLFRYLKQSKNMSITYRRIPADADNRLHPISLTGYSDSDWASNIDDRKSVTGYVFTIAGGAVSWQSKKQPTVALSSTEAEYMSSTQACKEAIWWRALLGELQLGFNKSDPTTILADSQGCIALAKNPEFHARTKHIDVQHHFVREKVAEGVVILKYISTNEMGADIMTKAVPRVKFQYLISLIGLRNRGSIARS